MSPKIKSEENENIEKLICDYGGSKFKSTVLIMKWARHLKGIEEHRSLPMAEIIELSIRQIMSGKVSEKEVLKCVAKKEAVDAAILNKKEESQKKDKQEKKPKE